MHFKKLAQAGACVLAIGMASVNVAEAGVIAGANIGSSQFDYDYIENGSAKAFYIGYELTDSPVYFELAKIDSGDADVSGYNSVSLNVSGTQFGVGYRMILNPETGSDFFGKVGYYSTDTELADPDGEICGFPCAAKDGNNGLYLGFGGTWMLGQHFGLRFDMQGLLGVEDFLDDNDVTFISGGPIFKFGGGSE